MVFPYSIFYSMYTLNRTFIFCLVVLLTQQVDARTDQFTNQMKGNAFVLNDSIIVIDDQWPAFANVEGTISVRDFVMLQINEQDNLYMATSFIDSVIVQIDSWDASNVYSTVMVTLKVSYNAATGTTYDDKSVYFLNNAHKITVILKKVPANPAFLALTSFIEVNRVYNLDSTTVQDPQNSAQLTHVYDNQKLKIYWIGINGADEYDLEYTFNYSNSNNLDFSTTYSSLDWLFKDNASRITTANRFTEIPLAYPSGYLFYRIRGARYRVNGERQVTPWSTTSVSSLSLSSFLSKYEWDGFRDSLNWQMNRTFAEEDKSISSITYFDGSLRSRQSVTELKHEKRSLIQNSLYDFFGRLVLNTLPWVDTSFNLLYKYDALKDSLNNSISKATLDSTSCLLTPIKWSKDYGPGNYYSPNNLLLSDSVVKKHLKFIPDAKNYPYVQKQYTLDGTGRIIKESNAGNILRLGAGHETRYLYGKPSQTDLDRLFGNDVGYDSSYLKNMVIDPNGQIHVSYLNYEGKIIASGLAGKIPSNLDGISDTIATVTLSDSLNGGALIDGKLLNTYGLLMPVDGNITIKYNLNPQAYNNSCKDDVCYDCLYTVKLSIRGTCNSANDTTYYLRNYTLGEWVDSSCESASGEINDSLTRFLLQGEYIITKEISLNGDSLELYADRFVANNPCVPSSSTIRDQLIGNLQYGCDVDCETCKSALGAKDDFLEEYINRVTSFGLTPQQQDTIDANDLYDKELAECIELCESESECASFRKILLADMGLGGQYFTYTHDEEIDTFGCDDPTSIFFGSNPLYKQVTYYNKAGGLDSVFLGGTEMQYPNELSIGDFIANWQDSWAESLIEFHPEYCYLKWCDSLSVYFKFDSSILAIDKYQNAKDSGWLNPIDLDSFFAVGGPGYSYRDSIFNFFNDPGKLGNCGTYPLDGILKETIFGTGFYGCGDTTGCIADYDFFWITFRGIYLAKKRTIVCKLINEYAAECATVNPDCIGANPGGCGAPNPYEDKTKRWICPEEYEGDPYDVVIEQMQIKKNEIIDSSGGFCEIFADGWMYQLRNCSCLSSDTSKQSELRDRLIAICKDGSLENHLIGTTSCTNPTSYGDTSFIQALDSVCGTSFSVCDPDCNARLITFPGTLNRPAYLGLRNIISIKTEDCICSNISLLKNCYLNKPMDDTTTSFFSFLQQIGDYAFTVGELDSLEARCSGVCYYLNGSVKIPPYLECDVCRTGSEVEAANEEYTSLCSGASGNRKSYNAYMNNMLGLNLDSADYVNYLAKYDIYKDNDDCKDAFLLCPHDIDSEYKEDTSCYSALLDLVNNQVIMILEAKRDSLRKAFIREYLDHCFGQRDYCSIQKPYKEYHFTLYYYDQSGALVKTVPPEGVIPITNTDTLQVVKNYRAGLGGSYYVTPKHEKESRYWVNSLNEVVKEVSPDAGYAKNWYDRMGRIVVAQKAWQKDSSYFTYSKYDKQNRIIETGQLKITDTTKWPKDTLIFTDSLFSVFYSNALVRMDVIRTYYDYVKFYVSSLFGTLGQQNLRKRISSVARYRFYVDVDTLYSCATHYSYDVLGNVKMLVQDIPGMAENLTQRFKKLEYEFDLVSGKVNKVTFQKDSVDQFIHRYTYNADNKLLLTETSRTGLIWDRDALYTYYPHGPLARKELGELRVQGMDYAYTIQGWLKGLNSSLLDSLKEMGNDGLSGDAYHRFMSKDAFAFTLNYFNEDYQSIKSQYPVEMSLSANMEGHGKELFDGNIRNAVYAIQQIDTNKSQAYTYRYDQLSRLKSSLSWSNYNADTFSWNNTAISVNLSTNYTYSPDGNIQKLSRFANSTTQYDSLAYSYYANSAPYSSQNKNQLKQITDTQSSGSYSYDIDSQPTDNYGYDASGQLIKDSSESITKIMWTAYGKVDSIVKSNNQRIKYEYDAMDHRVMKKINYAGGSLDTITYYIYDAQGNVLSTYQKVKQTSGGSYAHVRLQDINLYGSERLGNMKVDSFMYATARLGSAGAARNYSMGKKRYELTDHLGNVYSTITDRRLGSGTAGQVVTVWNPDVLTAQDYLPYGMPIYDKLYKATSTSYYKYAFNGKEKDDETKGAYNSYDYGYRMYDPRACKFLSVDPIKASYPMLSPYQFASLNPIKYIDLDGLEGADIKFESGHSAQFIGGSIMSKEDKQIYNDAFDGIVGPFAIGFASEFAIGEAFGWLGLKIFGNATKASAEAGTKTSTTVIKQEGNTVQVVEKAEKSVSETTKKLSKVERTKTTETIGGKYTKTTEVKPGKGPGQSRAEYVKYKNQDGKTIKMYKDSYDRANKFQHRKSKLN